MLNLKQIFADFLKIDIADDAENAFDNAIPLPLRELYAIKNAYNKVKPNNELFVNQDRLTFENKLDLSKNRYPFLVENQGNWQCLLENGVENPRVFTTNLEGNDVVIYSLEDLLAVFALQELTFELQHISYCHWETIQIKSLFPNIKILLENKSYVYQGSNHSYYSLENEIIFADISNLTCITSNNLVKLHKVEQLL